MCVPVTITITITITITVSVITSANQIVSITPSHQITTVSQFVMVSTTLKYIVKLRSNISHNTITYPLLRLFDTNVCKCVYQSESQSQWSHHISQPTSLSWLTQHSVTHNHTQSHITHSLHRLSGANVCVPITAKATITVTMITSHQSVSLS